MFYCKSFVTLGNYFHMIPHDSHVLFIQTDKALITAVRKEPTISNKTTTKRQKKRALKSY